MNKNHYYFSSEAVSQGHPDLVADRIADEILDSALAMDPNSHCGIECAVTTGQVFVLGEVKTNCYLDIDTIVRETIKKIGYTKPEYKFDGDSCGVLSAIHEQSPDIDMGVTRENEEDNGAGDQGMPGAYSTNETENYIPATLDIATKIVKELAIIRENETDLMPYLRPDAKSQVTIEYDENDRPVKIDTIVVSTSHDEFADDETMLSKIRKDIIDIVIPRVKSQYSDNVQKLFGDNIKYFINPTGRFVLSGPSADSGLCGRKLGLIQGGRGTFAGGALCGKCASKVDRSAAYMARYITKNCVAAGISDRMNMQISYAIGVAKPVSVWISTEGTNHTKYSDGEIAQKLSELFDLRPTAIINKLKLKQPMFAETAAYGHFGRKNEVVHKHFENKYGNSVDLDVELFTWEKLDKVDMLKEAFGLN